MTVPDGQPTFGPPTAGDEVATLLGSLERQRATFAWKVAGLDSNGLAAKVGASAITLGGLIKHLAFVEDLKLTTMVLGQTLVPPWVISISVTASLAAHSIVLATICGRGRCGI